MKNMIILSFVLSFLFFVSCGDDNGSEPTDTPDISLISYDTLLTTYTDNYTQLSTSPVIKNIDNESISVIAYVEVVELPQNHSYQVCLDGNCSEFMTDAKYELTDIITLAAGESLSAGQFQIKYKADDNSGAVESGTGVLKIGFYEQDDIEDKVEFTLHFEVNPPVFELVEPDILLSGSSLSQDELLSYCQIKNNTDEEISVKAKMEIISLVDGHMVALCTDICYAYTNQDFTAPGPIIVPANSTSERQSFAGHYNHTLGGGIPNTGTSEIKYIFYLEDNPDISKEYTCTFIIE